MKKKILISCSNLDKAKEAAENLKLALDLDKFTIEKATTYESIKLLSVESKNCIVYTNLNIDENLKDFRRIFLIEIKYH